ncbi:MAG: hypothetical protein WAN69_16330 [Candidatus Korobacteraceae bacterium]|jgi:hypothetical protein
MNEDSIIRSVAVERGVADGVIKHTIEDIDKNGESSPKKALT